MRGRSVPFSATAIQHVYQRAVDHGVIFYSDEDRLVYYTLCAANSKKYGIKVCAGAIMFTHTHQSCIAPSLDTLRKYLHDVGTSFARLYNYHYKRAGKLLELRPGIAQKSSDKSQRTNILYVFNNHVEKGLCNTAMEERWSLLAYADNQHPFSPFIRECDCSPLLKKALRLVDRRASKLKAIEYTDLDSILPNLSPKEREQFIDYVISRYQWINYTIPISKFGSLDKLKLAAESTSGHEYDLHEDYSPLTDVAYVSLPKLSQEKGFVNRIFSMEKKEQTKLILSLSRRYGFHPEQLSAFFHDKQKG